MARRKNTAGFGFILALIPCVVIFAVGKAFLNTTGPILPFLVLIAVLAGIVWYKHLQGKKRTEQLLNKYRDEEIVSRILLRHFWQGQTAEQLVDSVGNPVSVDRKTLVSRKREIWKYNQRGRNRYGLRVTLDDDVVIGWDQKNG